MALLKDLSEEQMYKIVDVVEEVHKSLSNFLCSIKKDKMAKEFP